MIHKKNNIPIAMGLLLALLMAEPIALAQNHQDRLKMRKHLVQYGTIQDKHVDTIAKNVDMFVTNYRMSEQVRKIKTIKPALVTLMYKNLLGMHPYYDDWAEVSRHEGYFLHDKTLGLRLKEKYFGWYVMDIGNSGWVRHFGDYLISKLDALKVFDGVFADDVWKDLYFNRFYVDIKGEEAVVNKEGKIVVRYSLLIPAIEGQKNKIVVRRSKDGEDLFGNGSFKDRTITPGSYIAPGTKVYVDYSASDPTMICPPDDRISKWRSHMASMIKKIKDRLGNKLLIMNTDELSGQFLTIADGMMVEGFGVTELKAWEDQVRALDMSAKAGKYYLAQVKIVGKPLSPSQGFSARAGKGDGNSSNLTVLPDPISFPLASFLLARGDLSSFSLSKSDFSTPFFEDPALNQMTKEIESVSAQLGKATGGLSVYAERKESTSENLLWNGSFNEGFTTWTITERCLGTPSISSEGGRSAYFATDKQCGSTVMSDFIPVNPQTLYRLDASVKASNVIAGNPDWQRLTLIGRFYDAKRNRISDYIADLPFDVGSYDWKDYTISYQSPANASFFRITSLGLYPNSTGEGWVKGVFFRKDPEADMYKIYTREFEKGVVLVNPSKARYTEVPDKEYRNANGQIINSIEMDPNTAVVLYR